MSAAEVGSQLCNLCREGRNLDAINELYSSDIVSVEAAPMEGLPQTMEGIDQVRGKNEWWVNAHEVHRGDVKGPFPHGDDKFAVLFSYDVTNKESGHRMEMEEVGVYTVAEGKVVKEEFFFGAPN